MAEMPKQKNKKDNNRAKLLDERQHLTNRNTIYSLMCLEQIQAKISISYITHRQEFCCGINKSRSHDCTVSNATNSLNHRHAGRSLTTHGRMLEVRL